MCFAGLPVVISMVLLLIGSPQYAFYPYSPDLYSKDIPLPPNSQLTLITVIQRQINPHFDLNCAEKISHKSADDSEFLYNTSLLKKYHFRIDPSTCL